TLSSALPPACGRATVRAACVLPGPCVTARSGSTTTTSSSRRQRWEATAAAALAACMVTTPFSTSPNRSTSSRMSVRPSARRTPCPARLAEEGKDEMPAQDTIPAVHIDPFSIETLRDPQPFQRALREAGEFAFLPTYGIWATGRYDRVRDILSDWQTFRSSGGVGLINFHKEKPWRRPSLLLENDPPAHTHYRAVMLRALSPVVLRELRPAFAREAEMQLERLLQIRRFDAVKELAEGYPLKVFGDAVGVQATDRTNLLRYGDISFNALGPRNELFHAAMEQ